MIGYDPFIKEFYIDQMNVIERGLNKYKTNK